MSKIVCTASIFLVLVAVLIALFAIQVPHNDIMSRVFIHYIPGLPDTPELLITWIAGNILPLALAIALVALFWQISRAICSKLRGEK